MKPIAILSNFRMGTHYLMDLITSNGYKPLDEIMPVFRGEIKRELGIPKTVTQIIEGHNLAAQLRSEQEKENLDVNIIDELKYKINQNAWGDIDIKELPKKINSKIKNIAQDTCYIIHKNQARGVWKNEILSNLKILTGDQIVVSLKRDIVDSALSWAFAQYQDSFFSFIKSKKTETFKYNYDQLLRIVNRYKNEWKWEDETVKELNAIEITYEELYSNPLETIRKINPKFSKAETNKFQKQNDPLKKEYADKFRKEFIKKNGYSVYDK